MAQPVIFINSHKDEKEKERLLTHLGVLQHQGLISLWSDSQISPGADWQREIGEAIAQAHVAILFISANFLASDFILKKEVPALLQRRQHEGLIIFPVIAKPCAWQQVDWLASMKVRPEAEKSIWGRGNNRIDEDLAAIAAEVSVIVRAKQILWEKVRNPFHYGGPVPSESFVGHRWAVDFCQARLTGQGPANIAISGERRIGKTSLLHYLRDFGSQEAWGQYLGLFLDLGIFGGAVKPTAFWQYVLHLLKEKLDPTSPLVSQITHLQSRTVLTTLDFSQFLNEYRQVYPAQPLLLLLDEFEYIFHTYTPEIQDLLVSLRALTLSNQEFTVVTVTRKPLPEVCQFFTQATKGLEFHSHFVPCHLEYFNEEETTYVVQTLLNGTNITFTLEELAYIWEKSQGQWTGALPILVQASASLIFEYKQRYTGPIDYHYLDRQFERQTQFYRPDSGSRLNPSSLMQTAF